MTRNKKKRVFKVGDIVRIKNPVFVQRVGYPWTKEYVKTTVITEEQKKSIWQMLGVFGLDGMELAGNKAHGDAYERILDILAYHVLRNQGFGGSERTLHTEIAEEYRDKPARVIAKKCVKTGVYRSGSSGYDYYNGGFEYDPPYLSSEKTHVILSLEIYADDDRRAMAELPEDKNLFHRQFPFMTDIEDCNVEALKEWEVSLWPNNQPPILLGVYQADTADKAKQIACEKNKISPDDDALRIAENGADTPLKKWKKMK